MKVPFIHLLVVNWKKVFSFPGAKLKPAQIQKSEPSQVERGRKGPESPHSKGLSLKIEHLFQHVVLLWGFLLASLIPVSSDGGQVGGGAGERHNTALETTRRFQEGSPRYSSLRPLVM